MSTRRLRNWPIYTSLITHALPSAPWLPVVYLHFPFRAGVCNKHYVLTVWHLALSLGKTKTKGYPVKFSALKSR